MKRLFTKDITKEMCYEFKAQNPDTKRNVIRRCYCSYYFAMRDFGILDELYPTGRKMEYSEEEVIEIVGRYNNVKDLSSNYNGVYNWILRNNRKDLLSAYVTLANKYKRGIYVYEFSDHSAYVGLTYDFNRRNSFHIKSSRSPVYRKGIELNETPKMKILVETDATQEEAKLLEAEWLEKYRSAGWNMLNKAKAGGLGAYKRNERYTKEEIYDVAKNYTSSGEFRKEHEAMSVYAHRRGWLKEWFTLRKSPQKAEEKLTDKQLIKELEKRGYEIHRKK